MTDKTREREMTMGSESIRSKNHFQSLKKRNFTLL